MTPHEVYNVLISKLNRLSERDRSFAKSLCEYFARNLSWSAKQWHYAQKLADIANTVDKVESTPVVAPVAAPPVVDVILQGEDLGNIQPVVDMLKRAFDLGVEFPAIRLGDFSVRRAKTPDLQLVVRNADKTFLGKFTGDRWFVHPRYRQTATEAAYIQLMREYLEDPIAKASLIGRRFGRCMFCGRGLERDNSINVGYGPVCADRYGLPWGNHASSWREQAKNPEESLEQAIY